MLDFGTSPIFKRFFILTILISFSVLAHAQQLWRGTRAGMTPSEVKRIFKHAVKPPEPSTLHDGAVGLYRIENIIISGHPFFVEFYFKNDRLSQVSLTADGIITRDTAINLYSEIFKSMFEKYGKPDRDDLSEFHRKELVWLIKNSDITLYYFGLPDNKANLLKIIYGARISNDKSNL